MPPVPRPKDFLPSVKIGTFMAIATAVCPFARRWFHFRFDVNVNIFELGDGGMNAAFPYDVSLVANFIFTALVFNVLFWIAFKYLAARIDGRQRFKNVLELFAIGIVVATAMGVAFHWGLDRANGLYQDQYGHDTTPAYAYIYYMDEWLGHALQETGIMGYFVVLVVTEQVIPRARRIHWVELPFVIGIAAVVAVVDGYAALASETAIIMLVASCIFLGAELAYKFAKKASFLENPLLLATAIANIAVIVQNVVFIGLYGLSPWYPWLRPA